LRTTDGWRPDLGTGSGTGAVDVGNALRRARRGARPALYDLAAGLVDLRPPRNPARTDEGVISVLILLPPSEGKSTAGRGRALDLAGLSRPELNPAREQVLDALVELCTDDVRQARTALGLGPTQDDEIARNARLRQTPTRPAGQVYTGVLYDALDLASLDSSAARLASRSILVFSGLWGAVRITDRIPAYRCPVGVNLPGVGGLGGYWRRHLTLTASAGPVLDLRSGAYAAMWSPPPDLAPRTAAVRVLHERMVNGTATRSVVSHFNKATKGRLVRDLLLAGAKPTSVGDLVSALRDLKYLVEAHPAADGKPWRLDIIVTEL
jgi:cytoplasmic iron level regulating protein YaaA (DUF328/UPF0246 family)